MFQLKRLVLLIFLIMVSPIVKGESAAELQRPLAFYKQYYTKEEIKKIHILNMKILLELEKRTRYPNKLVKEQASYKWIRIPLPFINEAHALGIDGKCFFGGWMTSQGSVWCHVPWKHTKDPGVEEFGPTYNPDNYCNGSNLFRCNPVLFGKPKNYVPKLGDNPEKGICIEISSYDHVTRKCTEIALRHVDEFVDVLAANTSQLEEFLEQTVHILKYCDADELDYCDKLREYLAMVTQKAEDCAKAQANEILPRDDLPLSADELVTITEEIAPVDEDPVSISGTTDLTIGDVNLVFPDDDEDQAGKGAVTVSPSDTDIVSGSVTENVSPSDTESLSLTRGIVTQDDAQTDVNLVFPGEDGQGSVVAETVIIAGEAADVVSESVTEVIEETPAELSIDEKIDKYSKSPETLLMIQKMRNIFGKECDENGCSGSKTNNPSGSSWTYVKHGLMRGGFADKFMEREGTSYPKTETKSAKNAGKDFFEDEDVKFTNLLDNEKYKELSSKDAPVGAVLVYEGGEHGHIEVKGADSEYLSDFRSQNPIDSTNAYRRTTRKLIGVYVKID